MISESCTADMGRFLETFSSPFRLDGGVRFVDILDTVCSKASSVEFILGGALNGGGALELSISGVWVLDGALEGGGTLLGVAFGAEAFRVRGFGAEGVGFDFDAVDLDLGGARFFFGGGIGSLG